MGKGRCPTLVHISAPPWAPWFPVSSLPSLCQPANTTCHLSSTNNLSTGALGDQSRSFVTDGDPPSWRRGQETPLSAQRRFAFLGGEISQLPYTQRWQELFLKQSPSIVMESRCSFKTAVTTGMPKELPPAKCRAPELPKDFAKPKEKK